MNSNIRYLPLEEILALPVYSTADVFPMLATSEFYGMNQEMTISGFASQLVRDGGVRDPLTTWNGMLLDGRNRRAAADEAVKDLRTLVGRSPEQEKALTALSSLPVRELDFDSELDADRWVISNEESRRQKNKSQRAASAALYWPLYEGRVGRPNSGESAGIKGETREILSRMFHVGSNYIQKARSFYLNDRSKFNQIHAGRKSLSEANKSPGQKINPQKDELDASRVQGNNGKNTTVQSIKDRARLGDDYETIKKSIEKYNREFMAALDKAFAEQLSDQRRIYGERNDDAA